MLTAEQCYQAFQRSIEDYHRFDNVDQPISNPYPAGSFEALLYAKNWIDTVQWHLEDIIRKPEIDPREGIVIKRRIDNASALLPDPDSPTTPKTSPRSIASETPETALTRPQPVPS